MIDLAKYPVAHPQVAARVVDGTAVIVLADSGMVNMLNPVGTRIWELVNGKRSGQDIVQTLVAEYTVSLETAQKDVVEFLEKLEIAKAVMFQDRSV